MLPPVLSHLFLALLAPNNPGAQRVHQQLLLLFIATPRTVGVALTALLIRPQKLQPVLVRVVPQL